MPTPSAPTLVARWVLAVWPPKDERRIGETVSTLTPQVPVAPPISSLHKRRDHSQRPVRRTCAGASVEVVPRVAACARVCFTHALRACCWVTCVHRQCTTPFTRTNSACRRHGVFRLLLAVPSVPCGDVPPHKPRSEYEWKAGSVVMLLCPGFLIDSLRLHQKRVACTFWALRHHLQLCWAWVSNESSAEHF